MKDFKIYLGIASALLVVYLIIQYNRPKPINWQPTLSSTDKIPFGTFILRQRLGDIFPASVINNSDKSAYSFFKAQKKPGNYIIIAKSIKITKDDFEEMTRYIHAGSNVFITGFDWNGVIADTLKFNTGFEIQEKNTTLNFTNKDLKRRTPYKFSKDISAQYFADFDTTRATVLSTNKAGNATYLRYKFGKGNLFVCANPQLFTNYSLLTTDGAAYASIALSYLPQQKNIFWDVFQNHEVEVDRSPLRVFFSNPSLQWAYYLSLFGLVIFVLFEIKRRQRVIPIIEPLKNTTVDFVNVVGQVYYEKRDNANIAHKKILYLLSHLRENYQIRTNKIDSELIDTISGKTGVDGALAKQLIDYISYIAAHQRVTDRELIELNHLIEKFYKAI
ncbi:DUF4350 domain-containing protein [Mucilaginibacter auburnensis]|uniref:DUF4350 domain-containing protein n=1 Tax=Mucilaginibacter auburnensis TaxID=1457233 RepID=A0A2H9VSN4_9SPHI|nr:DUF4350 domain-containing protein [Mucilaginibacter auburnensis]PJJ83833.1 hypothetical protein CLV57_0828 [Mucilaginibacter auburnensis]